MFPTLTATRYVVPLREGGSLPAILETDEGGYVVAKFRGAGQGARALVAELIVGGLAQRAGLPVPQLSIVELDESFGRSEPDPEIQDILRGSRGTNVAMAYLDGAFNFDPLAGHPLDPALAAEVVWLDAFVTNIDRTARNPNMMIWNGALWLIDHGAALYFHHNWATADAVRLATPFAAIKDHVLLSSAGDLAAADARMAAVLTPDVIAAVLEGIPASLLLDAPSGVTLPFTSAGETRAAYLHALSTRLGARDAFVAEAVAAQERRRTELPVPQAYRR